MIRGATLSKGVRSVAGLLLLLFPTAMILYMVQNMPEIQVEGFFAGSLASIGRSVQSGVLGGGWALILGLVPGYINAVYDYRGRTFIDHALTIPLLLPPMVLAVSYHTLFDMDDLTGQGFQAGLDFLRSPSGLAFIMGLNVYPFVYLSARIGFATSSKKYIRLGQSIGWSRVDVFRKIYLPLSMPVIALSLVMVSNEVMNENEVAEFLGVRTIALSTEIDWISLFDSRLLWPLAFLGMVGWSLIFALMQIHQRREKFSSTPVPNGRHNRLYLTGVKGWGFLLLCLVPIALSMGVPLFQAILHVGNSFHKTRLDQLLSDGIDTLFVGIVVGLLAILLVTPFVLLRTKTRSSVFFQFLMGMGYFVPSSVLGIIALIFIGQGSEFGMIDLLDSTLPLIFILGLKLAIFSLILLEFGLSRTPKMILDLLASLPIEGRRYWALVWKTLGSWILASFLLTLILTMRELTLTRFLHPFDFATIGMRIQDHALIPDLGRMYLWTLCLFLVGLYPIMFINSRLEAADDES